MAVAEDLDRAIDSQWDWVAEQTRTYMASGGTEGHENDGVYMLVLATTGRKTGQPRRNVLIYGRSGDDLVVVASNAGADENPAWFKNLLDDPSVGVQAGTHRFTARARVASPAERATLWPQMAQIFPLYDEYTQKTDRTIPIVLLTPEADPRSAAHQ
ncbi:nitroreductase family deazaflavin-dependent oxidoreductase [Nocardia sp. NPDC051756]|uniref:nitroreductase family deazaflavin-dependent oxidoreductase n=1 Tax=Nocardia sp. NPDC051756 TaxID=3154751 RepID=UPI0034244DCE